MIVCGNCGHQNQATDAFCGNCGQFLEWVGQKVEALQPDGQPVPEEAVPSESAAGLVDRLRHAVGLEAAATDIEPVEATSEPEAGAKPVAQVAPIRSPRTAAPPMPAPGPAPRPVVEVPTEPERAVGLEPDPSAAAGLAPSHAASEAATGPEPEPEPAERSEAAPASGAAPSSEARAAVDAVPEPEAPPPAPKPRRGGPSRRAAVTMEPGAGGDVVSDDVPTVPGHAPGAERTAAPVPVQPVARRPTVLPPAAPGAATATPAPATEPAPVQPAPVQPTQPASRQPTADISIPRPRLSVEAPTRVAQAGDLVCGTCGEPNDPTRRFCRRCGTRLTAAAPTAKAPWWRRIFRRTARRYEAGERKRTMRSGVAPNRGLGTRFRFVLRWALAGLVLLGVAGYVAVPSMGSLVNGGIRGVVDQVRRIASPSLTLVHAATTQASSTVTDHPAKNVTDGATNIDWQGDGDELVLTFTFERPIDLGAMNIWNGAVDSATKVLRTDLRRPAQLVLETQTGQTATIDLDDIHEKQVRYVDLSAVETLVIRVVQTYGPADVPLALSELEFLKKG